jgi:hypothetical protein
MLDKEYAIWLAAFWEGEGCFHIDVGRRGKYVRKTVSFSIAQKNRQPLDEIIQKTGLGWIGSKFDKRSNSIVYSWTINSYEDIVSFVSEILPYMRFRRKEVEEKLEIVKQWCNSQKRHKWSKWEEELLLRHLPPDIPHSLLIRSGWLKMALQTELAPLLKRHTLGSVKEKLRQFRRKNLHKEKKNFNEFIRKYGVRFYLNHPSPKSPDPISLFKYLPLIALYEEAFRLRKQYGWGYWRVAKKLNISPNTVKEWFSKQGQKYRRRFSRIRMLP